MKTTATEKKLGHLEVQRTGPNRLSLQMVDSQRTVRQHQDEYTQSLEELEIAHTIMRGEEEFPNSKWYALQQQRIEYEQTIEWAQKQPEDTVRDILGIDNPRRTLVELKDTLTPHPESDLILLVLLQHEDEIRDMQSSRNTQIQRHSNTTRASLHEYLTTAAAFVNNPQQRSQHPVLWHSLELACAIVAETYSQRGKGELHDIGILLDLVRIGLVEDHRLIRLRNAKRHWDPYSLEVETIDGLRKAVRDAVTFEDTRPQQIITIKRPDTFEEIIAGEPNLFLPIERQIRILAQATRNMLRSVRKKFTSSEDQHEEENAQSTNEVPIIKHSIETDPPTGVRRPYGAKFKPSTTSNKDTVINIPA